MAGSIFQRMKRTLSGQLNIGIEAHVWVNNYEVQKWECSLLGTWHFEDHLPIDRGRFSVCKHLISNGRVNPVYLVYKEVGEKVILGRYNKKLFLQQPRALPLSPAINTTSISCVQSPKHSQFLFPHFPFLMPLKLPGMALSSVTT